MPRCAAMKTLERDLGLAAVIAISMGAMIGSGIFILPALAFPRAGSGVILAYLLAGILVVPAALSKAEMATAMPEAGGTYLYIERALGPLAGTIAGVGTWFSLSFKGALALVGGVPYLLLVLDLPAVPTAVGLAGVLIALNLAGAKQTGRAQIVMVALMLAALGWFVTGAAGQLRTGAYAGMTAAGADGLLATTGLVFVSYAGVTKIASIAEEVEDPGRIIPLGILGSLAVTTLLYVAIVAVVVGIVPPAAIAGTLTPMAVAAEATLGTAGVWAVVLAAILALISTANAGILSSSRYPFAMARDGLVPAVLARITPRVRTPGPAIALTGATLLVLIVFVPLLQIAKLASAFQILVFGLINVAHLAFRASAVEYDPAFRAPLFPWVQVGGIATAGLLLTQMGGIALWGSAAIVAAATLWYVGYVRPRVDRQGAAQQLIDEELTAQQLTATAPPAAGQHILVAVTKPLGPRRERRLVRLAADIAAGADGHVDVIRFEELPDQVPLAGSVIAQTPADRAFEERIDAVAAAVSVPITAGERVSHDTKHAVVHYAETQAVDLIVAEHEPLRLQTRLLGSPVDWVAHHAPCPTVLVDALAYEPPTSVGLVVRGAGYSPALVATAGALAAANDVPLQTYTYPQAGTDHTSARLAELVDTQLTVAVAGPTPVTAETELPATVLRHGPRGRFGRAGSAVPATGATTITVHPPADGQRLRAVSDAVAARVRG